MNQQPPTTLTAPVTASGVIHDNPGAPASGAAAEPASGAGASGTSPMVAELTRRLEALAFEEDAAWEAFHIATEDCERKLKPLREAWERTIVRKSELRTKIGFCQDLGL